MTRDEHLEWCKKCTNQKLDLQKGIVCGLTDEIADFEEHCKDFNLDETIKETPAVEVPEDGIGAHEAIEHVSSETLEKLRSEQQLIPGIIAGAVAAIGGGLLWAVITVATGYQIGYMAIAVGFMVGFAIQIVGKGVDPIFGIIGGALALAGCVLGNVFSLVGFIAEEWDVGYFETIASLDLAMIVELMGEMFGIMDILFYGIAIYEGYKFAFRRLSEEDITPA